MNREGRPVGVGHVDVLKPPDQHHRDLISRDGLDRTLFVEAGAGTGKTTQLVERITNLVLDRGVELSQIAAITFTEAAATELRSRIRVRFEQRFAEADDLLEQAGCRAALEDTDRAAISTLHGFAGRLLGEFAVAAALPPRLRVLDEVSSLLSTEQRWQRFVDTLYDDPAREELLGGAHALVGIALEPRYLGQPSLRDVAAQLNQNWDLLEPFAGHELGALRPVDFSEFDQAVQLLGAMVGRCREPSDRLHRHLVDHLLPEASGVVCLPEERKLRALIEVGDRWNKHIKRVGTKANWADVEEARTAALAVGGARDRLQATVSDELLRHFLGLLAEFVLDSARARRTAGGLEFHDLLVLARNMLRTNDEARASLHRRYRHILLDEFQDTDPIQIELAVLIATSVAQPSNVDWSSLAVDDGRLFFVGDPKQSIYRFRRADIGLFLDSRDRFGADGGLARLTANFRSVAPILAWVNAFFGALMDVEVPGCQPSYESLHAQRRADSGSDHRPLLLGGAHLDEKLRADELRELEAAEVARTIADVRDRPAAWPVQDRSSPTGWRPARLGDIAILLPARTSLPFLRDALDTAAIPYRLATGTLVYDTQEVRDVLAVLRAVDDPSDQISLVAALRSPLYACSDVDLYRYRRAGGRWDLRIAAPDDVPPGSPVPAALGHLRALWERRWWQTPSEMLEAVLRERHAYLLGFGSARPADVWRRLRFLADQARAFEEVGGGGLRAFVEWAALQGADGARVHEPMLPETDEDSVRIMTIHGAKGLEFPITVLTGMSTQVGAPRRGVSVLWNSDGTPELRLTGTLSTHHHQPRADLEVEMDTYEKLRLFYVAATRACDHLIVSCHHKRAKNPSYAQLIWEFAADRDDGLTRRVSDVASRVASTAFTRSDGGDVAQPAAHTSRAASEVALQERRRWLHEREAMLDVQRQPRVLSATAMARDVDGGVIDTDDDGADNDVTDPGMDEIGMGPEDIRPARSPIGQRRGRAGSAVGRAVHATLQLLDLADPRSVDELLRQQCTIEAIPELQDTASQLVWAALRSDAVQLAARHRHHKELYVAAPIADRVIEGYVDLLVETPEGLVVVDYKTDAAASEAEIDAKLAAYERQGAAYAVALEAVTGQPVLACRFVFCRASGAVERSVQDLRRVMDGVLHQLGGVAPMPSER